MPMNRPPQAQKRTARLRNEIGAPGSFTVLIGSRARRAVRPSSDVDVVRIGHRHSLPAHFRATHRGGRISYIDYDESKFRELYERGSLFLYHVFTEGSLLEGDAKPWASLKSRFKVATNFREEISQSRSVLAWLQRGNKWRGAKVPYLAHTFRALKNLAIFSLAQRRHYVFDKRRALEEAFPQLRRQSIATLIDANDAFEQTRLGRPRSYDISETTVAQLKKDIVGALRSKTSDARS